MEPGILHLRGVRSGYGSKTVLHDLDLDLRAGEFCAIVGPNGCGKSTLLRTLVGAIPVTSGELRVFGVPIARWKPMALARKLALIPQETVYQFDFSVFDIVLTGQHPYLRMGQDYSARQRDLAAQALADFDLLPLRDTPVSRLSGGEKQRVHLARAWVQDTPVILMDESLANLDLNHQVEAMRKLSARNRDEGRLIVVVSHNVNLVAEYCDRILVMKDGRILHDGTPDQVVTEPVFSGLYDARVIRIEHPVSGRPNLLYPGREP